MSNFVKPRIIVSKCLGFENCRYDGSVINSSIVSQLEKHVEFITVCPEKEIGLGIPRKPVRLIIENDEKRLFQPATGNDVTENMREFTNEFLKKTENIDGFIVKHRSPTCGFHDVKIYKGKNDKMGSFRGEGIFGKAILSRYPDWPIEDEGRLRNFSIRENFLVGIFTLASFRKVKEINTINALIGFHTNNKMLFMAYNQEKMRKLGKITADFKKNNLDEVMNSYEKTLRSLLNNPPGFASWINMLQHALGYVSDKLKSDEKKLFLDSIEEYRDERIPLKVLFKLLHSWALRFNTEYLLRQSFLKPYPLELLEITDSGKGRDK